IENKAPIDRTKYIYSAYFFLQTFHSLLLKNTYLVENHQPKIQNQLTKMINTFTQPNFIPVEKNKLIPLKNQQIVEIINLISPAYGE
ncbi:hypothetical protein ABHA40_13740, partial [Enterococcus mundtii]|uniref:hypothetical protein n=2 Tax=Enterococcus mundtii TaxID=53346 RepID=UPI00325ADFC1